MNRVAAGAFNDIHNFVDAQITFARRRRANRVGFTGQAHMQGVAVGFAEHNGGWDGKVAGRGEEAHGELPSVVYEEFFQKIHPRTQRESRVRAEWRILDTVLVGLASLGTRE